MASQKEIELIEKARAKGWNDHAILSALKQRRHNIHIANEKARIEKEKQEAYQKWYDDKHAQALIDSETVDYDDVKIKGVDDARYHMITDRDGAYWDKNEGEEMGRDFGGNVINLSDQILDYRDDDFVAGTLENEYGYLGFEFWDDGIDKIKCRYTDPTTGKTYTHRFETNFVGGGGDKEAREARGLVKWMKEISGYGHHVENADYRSVKQEDGTYKWKYVDPKDRSKILGDIKSDVLLAHLDDKYPEYTNAQRFKNFKIGDQGEWLEKEHGGEWETVEDENLVIELDMQHEDARQNFFERKEGEEASIYNHLSYKVEHLKKKKELEEEYEKRKNTSLHDYQEEEWKSKNYKAGFQRLGKNLKYISPFHSLKDEIKEDYNTWVEQANPDNLPDNIKTEQQAIVVDPSKYEENANGEWVVQEEELLRLEELGVDIKQEVLDAKEYEFLKTDYNRLLASTNVTNIERNYSNIYEGENSMSQVIQAVKEESTNILSDEDNKKRLELEAKTGNASYIKSIDELQELGSNFGPGEYELSTGETITITEKDIEQYNNWHNNYKEYGDYEGNQEFLNELDSVQKKYDQRNFIDPNTGVKLSFADLEGEYDALVAEGKTKEARNLLLKHQSETSKFFDLSTFEGMNIDLDDFERYVKEQKKSGGLLSNLYVETAGYDTDKDSGSLRSAGLKWDEKRGRWFYSGGAKTDKLTKEGQYKIDQITANVLASYINSKVTENQRLSTQYEDQGMFNMIENMNNHTNNIVHYNSEIEKIIKEYDKLKSDMDSGTIEKSDENIDKLNKLSAEINAISDISNFHVDAYNKISNNPRNIMFIENYNELVDYNSSILKDWSGIIDGTNKTKVAKILKKQFDIEKERQRKLKRSENGHLGYRLLGTLENAWGSLTDAAGGIMGLAYAYVPEIWTDVSSEEKARRMAYGKQAGNFWKFDYVAEGDMLDPRSGRINWANVPAGVSSVVTDMYMMMSGGGLAKGAMMGIGKGGGFLAKKSARLAGITSKNMPVMYGRVSMGKNFIGKAATKADLLNRASQFSGGAMVIFPRNLEEAIGQVDDDFTMEDAFRSAWYKTATESSIEMLNPDIRWMNSMKRLKASKGFGDYRLWKNGANIKKMQTLFVRSLKQVPKEMLEENLQEMSNGLYNSYYNKHYNTDFHLPTVEDYKKLNILTPLSILTAGIIRTRGFTSGGPSNSMYLAAAENIDEFSKEMKKQVEIFEMTNGKKGLDPKEFAPIMNDVFGYVAIKNGIDPDDYNKMTSTERNATVSLLLKKTELERDIKEEQDPARKKELENDLNNIKENLKRVANTVETGYASREEYIMDFELDMLKSQWKMAELGSKEKKDLHEKIKKATEKRNEFRENASLYEFDGQSYNSTSEFMEAIQDAKKSGYFDNPRNRPRIRISHKVDSRKAEYLSNMVNKLTGNEHFSASEVLMENNVVQEAQNFINSKGNQGKSLQDYKNELREEEKKKKPDVNKLNDLRIAKKYLELIERGYEHSERDGGMIMDNYNNLAVRQLEEQRLTDKLNSIKEITEQAGVKVGVYSQDTIQGLVDNGTISDSGAITANAFVHEQVDQETGKRERVIVINSTVALQNKAFTSPSHELLHIVLFSVLNGPARTVEGPNGEMVSVRITEKGVKLIKGFLELLPPDQKQKLEDELYNNGYKHSKWDSKNRKPVEGTELPFEAYAEEYLNHYHDLVVNKKTIPLNEPKTRSTLMKIADYFKNFWKQNVEEDVHGVMDTSLDTPEKVLEFMRSFNKQALQNKFNDQLVEMAFNSQEYFTEATKEDAEEQTQFSKLEAQVEERTSQQQKEDLAKETNDIWADKKLSLEEKAFTIAQKYGGMAATRIDVAKANAIQENRDIMDLHRQDMIAEMTYDLPEDPELKSRNVVGLVKDYPEYVAKQEKAGLDVAPLSGFINRWFRVRSYDVLKKYTKDKGFKKAMDDAMNEVSKMEADEVKKREDEKIKSGRILVSERLIKEDPHNEGKIDRVNKYNEDITNRVKQDPSIYEDKDYKTLLDLDPRGTVGMMMFDPTAVYKDDGTPFWQSPKGKKLVGTSILESIAGPSMEQRRTIVEKYAKKLPKKERLKLLESYEGKVIDGVFVPASFKTKKEIEIKAGVNFGKLANNDNLNQQDIKALQPFISKHNQLLWTSLPQGFMTNKKGRPTTATGVQNVLLNPFYNKGRRVGNLYPQRKKTTIDTNKFLDVFGITPFGEVNIVGKESNVSQRVKALIAQHGKIMTNQQVRKTLFENGADPDVINRIANGKSKMVYSKNPQLGDVNPDTNKIEPGFGNREAQRVTELIRMYHKDPKSYDLLKELDPIFTSVVEDMFINPNPNLGRGLNYIPSVMLDKYTPKDFLNKNFKGKKYIGPKLIDAKQPDKVGEYQVEYVRQAVEFGLTFHPAFSNQSLKMLLGFKTGKTIKPSLYPDQLSQIENRKFTPEQIEAEEQLMKDNGIDPKIINQAVMMINSGEVSKILNDITSQSNLEAKRKKLDEYRSRLQEINTANENAMKYVSLKMKQAYNDSKIISPHFVYFNGQIQTNIIEGTRALSTFEYIYLIEGQQVPLRDGKVFNKPIKQKGVSSNEYYSSQEWKNYIKAWKKVDEWKEREKINKKTIKETGKVLVGIKSLIVGQDISLKNAIEIATINDLNWKNEHVGASATTHAERTSYIFSNGKSIDLANLGHDHRSAWVPKYLADKYFDAKIVIDGKLVDNKTSYEGPMRMTKFGKGKSSSIYHFTNDSLVPYLAEVEGVYKIVQDIRKLSDLEHSTHKKVQDAIQFSKTVNPSKGISIWDFDDTLATTRSNVLFTAPDGTTGKLNAEEYASQYVDLSAKGYVFDFSEFNLVVDGKIGPFFKKFQDRIEKFGIQDNFILTARPAESAPAIREFLLSQGIDIPLENITGLGNSTGEAKALWITEKVADGYNDIYFADDALANVQAVKNVLDQFDIKSKVQQAKIQFSRTMNPTFSNILNENTQTELDINRILEQTTGTEAEKVFSDAQAKVRGARKGMWKFVVPYSAEDFKGLIYRFVGKGRQGERHMAFFKKALFDPYNRAYEAMNNSKQRLRDQYNSLLKKFPSIKKDLKKKLSTFEGYDSDFTVDNAIRVYLWDKMGMEVPGLSQRDLKTLVDFVKSDSEIKAFADNLSLISNQLEGYVPPSDFWLVENIQSDINKINNELSRAEHLKEWKQNIEIIFGKWENGRLVGPNMNKIEALYGPKFRDALEDIIWRMEFGSKREQGRNKLVNAFNNWANQSVGAIMFFNMRSALLQTISSINYINWSDNNPLKAGAALLNFPQFIKDFTMIFNSDMMKQRRAGNQRGINEAELAEAVGGVGVRNRARAILHFLLTKGFLPTQIADSFAISSGGATFYRNRVNTYLKQGMSQKDAEAKAFQDFQENTEESQQSSRPDMISQQQASPLGRYILAFKNTPMQYARLMKKAFLDIKHGRGDLRTNISKIVYYGVVQNLIFNALQAALGAMIGADDDDEKKMKAYERVANGMIDSLFGGFGFGGQAVVTIKNTIMEYQKQREKSLDDNYATRADHTYTILKLAQFSPTIGSKIRKIYSAIQTEEFNRDVISEMGILNIDNPIHSVFANVISATTNVPLDRLIKKVDNVDAAITEDIDMIQRIALLMGWNTWDLDIDDSDVVAVEDEIKERKKIEKEEKKKRKKIEKEEKEEEENKTKEEENKKKKDGGCIAISRSGNRCKNKAESGGYCTIHAKVDQRDDGKKVQCKKIKSNKERCKMETSNKSGYCYYHD